MSSSPPSSRSRSRSGSDAAAGSGSGSGSASDSGSFSDSVSSSRSLSRSGSRSPSPSRSVAVRSSPLFAGSPKKLHVRFADQDEILPVERISGAIQSFARANADSVDVSSPPIVLPSSVPPVVSRPQSAAARPKENQHRQSQTAANNSITTKSQSARTQPPASVPLSVVPKAISISLPSALDDPARSLPSQHSHAPSHSTAHSLSHSDSNSSVLSSHSRSYSDRPRSSHSRGRADSPPNRTMFRDVSVVQLDIQSQQRHNQGEQISTNSRTLSISRSFTNVAQALSGHSSEAPDLSLDTDNTAPAPSPPYVSPTRKRELSHRQHGPFKPKPVLDAWKSKSFTSIFPSSSSISDPFAGRPRPSSAVAMKNFNFAFSEPNFPLTNSSTYGPIAARPASSSAFFALKNHQTQESISAPKPLQPRPKSSKSDKHRKSKKSSGNQRQTPASLVGRASEEESGESWPVDDEADLLSHSLDHGEQQRNAEADIQIRDDDSSGSEIEAAIARAEAERSQYSRTRDSRAQSAKRVKPVSASQRRVAEAHTTAVLHVSSLDAKTLLKQPRPRSHVRSPRHSPERSQPPFSPPRPHTSNGVRRAFGVSVRNMSSPDRFDHSNSRFMMDDPELAEQFNSLRLSASQSSLKQDPDSASHAAPKVNFVDLNRQFAREQRKHRSSYRMTSSNHHDSSVKPPLSLDYSSLDRVREAVKMRHEEEKEKSKERNDKAKGKRKGKKKKENGRVEEEKEKEQSRPKSLMAARDQEQELNDEQNSDVEGSELAPAVEENGNWDASFDAESQEIGDKLEKKYVDPDDWRAEQSAEDKFNGNEKIDFRGFIPSSETAADMQDDGDAEPEAVSDPHVQSSSSLSGPHSLTSTASEAQIHEALQAERVAQEAVKRMFPNEEWEFDQGNRSNTQINHSERKRREKEKEKEKSKKNKEKEKERERPRTAAREREIDTFRGTEFESPAAEAVAVRPASSSGGMSERSRSRDSPDSGDDEPLSSSLTSQRVSFSPQNRLVSPSRVVREYRKKKKSSATRAEDRSQSPKRDRAEQSGDEAREPSFYQV